MTRPVANQQGAKSANQVNKLRPKNLPAVEGGNGNGNNKGSGSKKKNKKRRAKRYGAQGAYKGVSRAEARQLANADIRDEVSGLKRDKNSTRRQRQNEVRQSVRDQRTTVNDMRVDGAKLDEMQRLNATQTAATNEGFRADSQKRTADSLTQLKEAGGTAQGMDQMSSIGARSSMLTDMIAQSGGNMLAVLAQMGNQITVEGINRARSDGQNERAGIRDEYRDQLREITESIQDTRQGRKGLTRQYLQQLDESGWGKFIEQQQVDIERGHLNVARGTLNLQRSQSGGGGGGGGSRGGGGYFSGGGGGGGGGSSTSTPATSKPKPKPKRKRKRKSKSYDPPGPAAPAY